MKEYEDKIYESIINDKDTQCKKVDYNCNECEFYCHCNNCESDEFHCVYDCDLIYCPLI